MNILKQLASPLNLLLVFIPIAFAAEFLHWPPVVIFITAALAVIPLSGILGDATEELSGRMGDRIGALINATLGNAAELIITLLALRAGLFDLVRASITGSIIGNILLVAGASIFIGGIKHGTQTFNKREAGNNAGLLLMSAAVLAVPSFFATAIEPDKSRVDSLSILTAGVILLMYVANIVYGFRTAKHVANVEGAIQHHPTHTPLMTLPQAIALLVVATIFIAIMSEFLVGAVEPMVKQIGISEFFVGIILVPIIGNVAEHVVAIEVAAKNKMDLSLGIAIGSSLQIALFVAPLLVFISLAFGQVLDLEFNSFELVALFVSCLIVAHVSNDGETNWLEGVLLMGLYVVMAIAFYFLPMAAGHH